MRLSKLILDFFDDLLEHSRPPAIHPTPIPEPPGLDDEFQERLLLRVKEIQGKQAEELLELRADVLSGMADAMMEDDQQ
jgi:hypothetical protein